MWYKKYNITSKIDSHSGIGCQIFVLVQTSFANTFCRCNQLMYYPKKHDYIHIGVGVRMFSNGCVKAPIHIACTCKLVTYMNNLHLVYRWAKELDQQFLVVLIR